MWPERRRAAPKALNPAVRRTEGEGVPVAAAGPLPRRSQRSEQMQSQTTRVNPLGQHGSDA